MLKILLEYSASLTFPTETLQYSMYRFICNTIPTEKSLFEFVDFGEFSIEQLGIVYKDGWVSEHVLINALMKNIIFENNDTVEDVSYTECDVTITYGKENLGFFKL